MEVLGTYGETRWLPKYKILRKVHQARDLFLRVLEDRHWDVAALEMLSCERMNYVLQILDPLRILTVDAQQGHAGLPPYRVQRLVHDLQTVKCLKETLDAPGYAIALRNSSLAFADQYFPQKPSEYGDCVARAFAADLYLCHKVTKYGAKDVQMT